MTVAYQEAGYAHAANFPTGTEMSIVNGGRTLTVLASGLTHAASGLTPSTYIAKGQPCILGDIVGVCGDDETATRTYVPVDTEGIYALTVVGSDDAGNSAVAIGDLIYINITTAVLSKIANKATNKPFGYALSTLSGGSTDIVAVKVHQFPRDSWPINGNGTTAVTTSTADKILAHERLTSSATSGTARARYTRLNISGAGGNGEALRAYTNVANVLAGTGGVHGAHITLGFGSTGTGGAGLYAGVRSQIIMPGAALGSNGTYYGGMSEIYGTASGTFAGTTTSAIHGFVLGGDATAAQTVESVFDFSGLLSGTGATAHIKTDMHTGTPTDGLKVKINGAIYYISLVAA